MCVRERKRDGLVRSGVQEGEDGREVTHIFAIHQEHNGKVQNSWGRFNFTIAKRDETILFFTKKKKSNERDRMGEEDGSFAFTL